MSQHPLPAGCHDAESARELLGVSKKALLKKMREIGWLYTHADQRNLPRPECRRLGWLTTQTRGYALRGQKNIAKQYEVMLLTQSGFQELKKIMAEQKTEQPAEKKPHQNNPTGVTHNTTPPEVFDRKRADAERQRALKEMARAGIVINQ